MSCRQNNGNSAATSLAKFLTDSEENLVSHIFHVARREATEKYGIEESKNPADLSKVNSFLNDSRSLARHDSRVQDSRRESLIRRIDDAQEDLIKGQVPGKATFDAWVELRGRLDEAQSLRVKPLVNSDPTLGVTVDGIAISRNEIELAKADYERLKKQIEARITTVPMNTNMSARARESLNMISFEVQIAGEKYRKLSDAYDATEVGYELLLNSPDSNTISSGYFDWELRKVNAEKSRVTVSPLIKALDEAEEIGFSEASKLMYETRLEAKKAEALYLEEKNPRNRNIYEVAASAARHSRRVFLYTILEQPGLIKSIENNDMYSPTSWANLNGYAEKQVSLNEVWTAVELHFSDIDNAEVRVGKIRDGEVARRAYTRAEARQSLLDSQGNGAIDIINRRYNESIRRKRGEVSKNFASN